MRCYLLEGEERRITISDVKVEHWPIIKKKLYFRCSECGALADFRVEENTICAPVNCAKCGNSEFVIPTEIHMGRGPWSDVLMLGQSLGIAYGKLVPLGVKEVKVTLGEKKTRELDVRRIGVEGAPGRFYNAVLPKGLKFKGWVINGVKVESSEAKVKVGDTLSLIIEFETTQALSGELTLEEVKQK